MSLGRELNCSGKSSASFVMSCQAWSGIHSWGFWTLVLSLDRLPFFYRKWETITITIAYICVFLNTSNMHDPLLCFDKSLPLIRKSSSFWGTPPSVCSILTVMFMENSNLCFLNSPEDKQSVRPETSTDQLMTLHRIICLLYYCTCDCIVMNVVCQSVYDVLKSLLKVRMSQRLLQWKFKQAEVWSKGVLVHPVHQSHVWKCKEQNCTTLGNRPVTLSEVGKLHGFTLSHT